MQTMQVYLASNTSVAVATAVVVVVVVVVLYWRSRFWTQAPVRHFYEWPRDTLTQPAWTRHCDVRVHTFPYLDESVDAWIEYVCANAPGHWDAGSLRGYLPGSTISVYADNGIKGAMLSRPVNLVLKGAKQKAVVHEFWIGGTTVLATHEYNRPVSPGVFVLESRLFSVVPLTHYPVYEIATSKYRNYKIGGAKINAGNVFRVAELVKQFKCVVVPPMERLVELLQAKLVSIYVSGGNMLVFKNTMRVHGTKSVMELVGVVAKRADEAYRLFSSVVFAVRQTYGYVRIHGNSHFEAVHRKTGTETHRYVYVYSYYAPSMEARDVFLL